MRTFLVFALLLGGLASGLLLYVGLVEVEGATVKDPSGRYTAVITFQHYQSWIPCAPGDSSGKPGFITIFDGAGVSYGKIPVAMISQLSDLRWSDTGARISAQCEWDFTKRTVRYWNDSQTIETVRILK